jgi:cell division protein FtsW (lipid II flippase)
MLSSVSHFLNLKMKQKTRDNLVYVAVGLGIVALIVADFFYSDSHGLKMWWPSRFESRAGSTTLLLAYFVGRETRKAKANLAQVFACILFASIVHLAIVFTFGQPVDELSGISFSALAVVEMFLVFQLPMFIVRYLGN